MSNLERNDFNNSLARTDNLQNMNSSISRVSYQTQEAIDRIVTKNKDGLLQKLFPDNATRAVIAGELALVKTEFEFRRKVLEKVRQTHIQSLTELCNQYLVREKAEIRAGTANFLLRKRQELQDGLDQVFDDFLLSIEEKIRKADNIQNPRLRQIRLEQLDRDIEGFVRLQEKLMNKFQNIVSEEI